MSIIKINVHKLYCLTSKLKAWQQIFLIRLDLVSSDDTIVIDYSTGSMKRQVSRLCILRLATFLNCFYDLKCLVRFCKNLTILFFLLRIVIIYKIGHHFR